jgi:hypothetical protein
VLFRSVAVLAALVFVAAPAQADPRIDEKQCVAEYDAGQRARKDGDLLRARKSLLVCAQPSCPEIVHTDCTEWIREVEAQIPTITVSARWSDGEDIGSVRVLIDGALAATELDGRSIPINPGKHQLAIETEGKRVTQTFIANAGEKSRVIRLVVERQAPTEDQTKSGSDGASGLWAGGAVLAGLSLASLVAFTVLAVTGTNDLDELRNTCAPTCPAGSLDPIKRNLLIGDVMLGIGIAAGVGSIALHAVAATAPQQSASLTITGRF